MAFYTIEPWGAEYGLTRMDAIAASFTHALRTKTGFRPPSEFVDAVRAPAVAEEQSMDEQVAILQGVNQNAK